MTRLAVLKEPIPVHVTRPFGDEGTQGAITMPVISLIVMAYLFSVNVIGWGVYGIVELLGKLG